MEIHGEIRTFAKWRLYAAPTCPGMQTRADGHLVVTEILGTSLRSVTASVDDYLMNLAVAENLCTLAGD